MGKNAKHYIGGIIGASPLVSSTPRPGVSNLGALSGDGVTVDTFASLDPNSPSTGSFSNGNLTVTTANSGAQDFGNTALPSSGKVYWEVYVGAATTTSTPFPYFIYIGNGAPSGTPAVMYRGDDGRKRVDGTYSTYGATYTEGHVIGVAVDLDGGTVEFFKDGTGQGLITYDFSAETVYPAVSDGDGNNGANYTFNFGQDHTFAGAKSPLTSPETDANGLGEFYHQPPAGFVGLYTPVTTTRPTRRWGGMTGRSLVETAAASVIDHSLRLDATSDYMTWTPASAGNQRKWTLSFWAKKATQDARVFIWGAGTSLSELSYIQLGKNSDSNRFNFLWRDDITNSRYLTTTAAFPTGVWTHVVMGFDAENTTTDDKIKLYIGGSLVTSFVDDDRYTLSGSSTPPMNAADRHAIGVYAYNLAKPGTSSAVDLADMHFIDGQVLAATDFGEFVNGTWYPKAYTGTYGTNGWHLDFADNSTASALGTDVSGSGNNWTEVSLTTGSQLTDVPSSAPATTTLPTTGVLSLPELYQGKL